MSGLWKKRRVRSSSGGRRITGIVNELPLGVKYALLLVGGAGIVILTLWGGWALFKNYYFQTKALFTIQDMRQDVSVVTGKMVKPDFVYEAFGLTNGVNQFSVDIEEQRKRFLMTPNVRDISITRTLPNKLAINIIEREPVAQVSPGPRGLVTDEAGVIFMRYADTGMLPLIRVSDEFAQVSPGDRLSGMEMAAIKVILSAQRPGFKLRIVEVNARNDDYLLLTFSDYRKAKFAWKGMKDCLCEKNDSAFYLQRQLDRLASSMESVIGQPRQIWDATQADRIYAMPIAVQ